MREIKKPGKKRLLNWLGVSAGAALLAAVAVIISLNTTDEAPMIDNAPDLYLPVMLMAMAGITLFTYGAIQLIVSAIVSRGKNVFINGAMLREIKVFDSKYKSATALELEREIARNLERRGFKQLGNNTDIFWRTSKLKTDVFYFADIRKFENGSLTAEELKSILRGVMSERSGVKSPEMNTIVFMHTEEATDSQLGALTAFRDLCGESGIIAEICLYGLTEKRVYITYFEQNASGISIERVGATAQNLAAGYNKIELGASSKNTSARKYESKPVPENTRYYDLSDRAEYGLKAHNAGFMFSAVSGGTLVSGFFIALAVWLAGGRRGTLTFVCIFVPLFLVMGLVLIYFALSTYKKITVSRAGVEIKRIFGNVKIFEGKVKFVDKYRFRFGAMPSKRVYVIYPADGKEPGDLVFSANNFKSYILVKFHPYNKAVFDKTGIWETIEHRYDI